MLATAQVSPESLASQPPVTTPATADKSNVDTSTLKIDDKTPKAAETFNAMQIGDELLRGICSHGFEEPTAIQMRGILPILDGQDIIAQAQSGTGKTATIVIATLQNIDTTVNSCQAAILAPTREVATLIQKVVLKLGDYMKVSSHACIGGTSVRENARIVSEGVQIVVGTPDIIFDLINCGALRLDNCKMSCLDDADEILDRGFKDQICDIFCCLPETVQYCVFSANISRDVLDVTRRFMRDPVRILVKRALTLDGIKQFYIDVEREEWKLDTLCDLYEVTSTQAIVYCNGSRKLDWLTAKMASRSLCRSFAAAWISARET